MILICAKGDDGHALKVASILEATFKEEVFIFDTSAFPTNVSLNGRFGSGSAGVTLSARNGQKIIGPEIKSVWWRRPQSVTIDSRITDPTSRDFALQECFSGLYGMLACFDGLWVNHFKSESVAEYKPFQLKVAREHGFEIPETLITSDPEAAVQFWREHDRNVVYKAFNQRGIAWRPTRALTEGDLPLLENLRHAPVIFQTMVPGTRDVRVTVIGNEMFATEFDIEQMQGVDYRTQMGQLPCRTHELPGELRERIGKFMEDMKLEYSGVDFRLTADGRYVFFEINTAGEFLYIEERTGQPIAEEMAAHLARAVPAHRVREPQQ